MANEFVTRCPEILARASGTPNRLPDLDEFELLAGTARGNGGASARARARAATDPGMKSLPTCSLAST